MAIHIKNIQANNLGPISAASFDLGLVNLFYGQNESGKTFLTEFILSSVFTHAKKWQLRDINPSGSISISGLDPDPVLFSPSSSRKIEDYWNEIQPGLPANMARLLVVKGADLSLTKTDPGGVGREVLKNTLTSQHVLDSIRSAIPATAQNAELSGHLITGKNQGLIKEMNNLSQSLSEIKNLLSVIEQDFQGGALKELELRKISIQDELTNQQNAKGHQAYLLWNEHQNMLAEREKYSDQLLFLLRDQIRDYQKTDLELDRLENRIKDLTPSVDAYQWLSKAISVWESQNLEKHQMPSMISLVMGGFLILAGIGSISAQHILSIPDLFWPSIAGIVVGIGFCAFYGYKYFRWSGAPAESDERTTIKATFLERFGRKLKGLTDLHHQRTLVEKDFHQNILIHEEKSRLKAQLFPTREKINNIFSDLIDNNDHQLSKAIWVQTLDELFAKAKEFDTKNQDLLIEFTKLNVAQNDFQTAPTGTIYDPVRINELLDSLDEINRSISEQESQLESLKMKACSLTGNDITASWSDVLTNLRNTKYEISANHKILIAELTAMIGLTSILNILDSKEDQKIIQTVNQDGISQLLYQITGKYQKISLEGEQLLISDGNRDFSLQNLSTGARDQVQMALRLGLASHLSGGQPLFLVLDDAFQHSDWDRRITLIEEIAAIAEQGWQIIYLTMDDHIRDLFLDFIKPQFKKKFRYFEMA